MRKPLIHEPPVAIAVTWGKEMIQSNGGLRTFIRAFHEYMIDDDSHWLHKCSIGPKQDVTHVYIVLGNRYAYKCYYGGYERGSTTCYKATGEMWQIDWPRIILAGPVERAPYKITRRGFQGFRYLYKHLWILLLMLLPAITNAQTRGWDSVKVSRDEALIIKRFKQYDPCWDSTTKAKWRTDDSIIMKQYDEDVDRYLSWHNFIIVDSTGFKTYISKYLIPYRTL